MTSVIDNLLQVTDPALEQSRRWIAMRGFAEQLRWNPTYEISAPVQNAPATDHLIVEHGLANSAAISFIHDGYHAEELTHSQIRNLLTISYNNLVDWHIFVSRRDAVLVNNLSDWRNDRSSFESFRFSPSNVEALLTPNIIAERVLRSRAIKSCDDVLIDVVQKWKRLLRADIPSADSKSISTLFNALFFVRGCEDKGLVSGLTSPEYLLKGASEAASETISAQDLILKAFAETKVDGDLKDFIDFENLDVFDNVDRRTFVDFISDLYRPRNSIYDLNFALLSKHALSRIYEKFVSIFVEDLSVEQTSFISPVPSLDRESRSGAVYTPQFVASFFARFIRDHVTAKQFRNLRTLDPACGSGIFLRTLLEAQCNPLDASVSPLSVSQSFERSQGIDRDPNAVEATKLSLALLHLVATNSLPEKLSLVVGDSIALAKSGRLAEEKFDAILTNPPYIKLDHLTAAEREEYTEYLGSDLKGRVDAYLAFIKLCLENLAPGGFTCFVLPQMVMSADNAQRLRENISKTCVIRCLIDLSSIRIFDGVGTYSVLLVIEKIGPNSDRNVDAIVGHATDFIGEALQAALEGREAITPYYRIFKAPQSAFNPKRWLILGPAEQDLAARLERMPKLGTFADWKQGFATGNDKIFIRMKADVPRNERAIYMDYLPDRSIGKYNLPEKVNQVVFYPYLDDRPVDIDEIAKKYPHTWNYLNAHKAVLTSRRSASNDDWWRPTRPRSPETMRRPKIVCPHLMLTPRFSIDYEGRFAIKRAPIMNLSKERYDRTFLSYLCAVLNSPVSAWFIKTYVPSFSNGYSVVEPKFLSDLPVPRFEEVAASEIEEIANLVDRISELKKNGPEARRIEEEISHRIMTHYDLTSGDLEFLGL